jgi:hypothetical protein
MRLREVGPGIGGLNYAPLLRNIDERKMRRALDRLPVQGIESEPLERLWRDIRAAARKMGQAIIAARMAQARRIIELETAHLRADGTRHSRDAIGVRYY